MKLKILLVEDNADARSLLVYLLGQAGYEVHGAATMQAALRDFSQRRCDVLVSDIGLCDGSGHELMRALRRSGEPPYGIAISGFGAAEDVAASLAAGFRHHLVKPIETAVLERLVEAARDELGRGRGAAG